LQAKLGGLARDKETAEGTAPHQSGALAANRKGPAGGLSGGDGPRAGASSRTGQEPAST